MRSSISSRFIARRGHFRITAKVGFFGRHRDALAARCLLHPLFAAFAFPKSEAVAWSMLGFVIVGSVGVAIYVFARTLRDLIERRIGWAICGSLSAILLVLPWAWTFFMPANEMTIG